MGRYSFSMWMGKESQGSPSGDQVFIGIDEKTPDPADLKPGYVRKAYNCRIVNGDLGTRGGLCLPVSINAVSFGKIYGRGYYVDPANGVRWLLVAVTTGVWAISDGQNSKFIGLPTGSIISGPCDLVAAYGVVVLFMGAGITPLYWSGTWTTKFGALPSPVTGKVQIPSANTAEFSADRIIVPYSVDGIAISDVGSYYSYSNFFSNFQINQGDGDQLIRVKEWTRGSVFFFKQHSIYLAQNFSGDLSTMILNRIPGRLGLVGRRALVEVGSEIFFMDYAGVYRMQQAFEDTPEAIALPISEPIKYTMEAVNWNASAGIVAETRKDRVYFAVPLGSATRNNALLVWNITNQAWESVDTFPNNPTFGIDDLISLDYDGERRLFAVDYTAGAFYLLETDGYTDLFGFSSSGTSQIYTQILTRGYTGPGIRSNYRHLRVGMGTWNPSFTANVYTSGVGGKSTVASNITRPNTKYWGFGIPDWVPSNVNNDWGNRMRKDYHIDTSQPITLGSGIVLNQKQETVEAYSVRVPGRYVQLEIINTQGAFDLRDIVFESWETQRGDKVEV